MPSNPSDTAQNSPSPDSTHNSASNPTPEPTPESEQQLAILDKVEQLFMKVGVRTVTMDDVASELGISKKTLYKHFRNKGDLVQQCMQRHISEEQCALQSIKQESENAIDALLQTTAHIARQLATLNPAVMHDAQKYYPETWALFDGYKHQFVYRHVVENLERGKAEGIYRGDLNPDVIGRIYVGRMDLFFDTKLFPPDRYRIVDVYAQFMDYHVRGIASPEGVAYLEAHGGMATVLAQAPNS
jgi:AcrR family transcriptional regulator